LKVRWLVSQSVCSVEQQQRSVVDLSKGCSIY